VVETVVGNHRFGWVASDGRLGGLGCDFATYRHRCHRYPVAVRLQEPLH